MRMNEQTAQTARKQDDEALQWMSRHLSGMLSPEEKHRFDQWYSEPLNRQAYDHLADAAGGADPFAEDLMAEAFEEELTEFARSRERPRWQPISIAAMAATIALVAAVVTLMMPNISPVEPHIYATGIGGRDTVPLADGSVITLNTATTLEVALNEESRLVDLKAGEAFFNVARDAGRTFSVMTSHGEVVVTGTSFNVRSIGETTSVSVVSGAVDIRPAGEEAVTLLAGDAISFGPALDHPVTSRFDATNVLSWRGGRVVFDETPLRDVAAELNRYYRTPLILGPGAPLDAPVTGQFDVDEQQVALRGLSAALSLDVNKTSEGYVLSPAQETE